MSRFPKHWWAIALFPLIPIGVFGCAEAAPASGNLSGKKLIVTLTFNGAIDTNQYYYFLINNVATEAVNGTGTCANPQNANGPIPTLVAPYGNGFATGTTNGSPLTSSTSTSLPGGFTDYVEYYGGQLGLFHVINGDPNNVANLKYEGTPIASVLPGSDPTNPASASTLQFTLDFSQLIYDVNGNPLTGSTAKANTISQALAVQWLQVNAVSTNMVPVDGTTNVNKITDSFGNGSGNYSAYLIVNALQNTTETNTDNTSSLTAHSGALYPIGSDDPPIDLISWSVQVVEQ